MVQDLIRKVNNIVGPTATYAGQASNVLRQFLPGDKSNGTRTVAGFIAALSETGMARPYNFECVITPPQAFSSQLSEIADPAQRLRFKITGSELPGMGVATEEVRRYGFGPLERHPYQYTFTEFTIDVLCGDDYKEIQFFTTWLHEHVIGNAGANVPENADGVHKITYYDDYVSPKIDVKMFDRTGQERLTCSIIDAYPITLAPVPLSWGTLDAPLQFNVSFAYRTWEIKVDGEPIAISNRSSLINALTEAYVLINDGANIISQF